MAKLKESESKSWLQKIYDDRAEWEKTHYVIKTQYIVMEYTPNGSYEDEYGRDHTIVGNYMEVSPWFDTEEEALMWADIRVPDQFHKGDFGDPKTVFRIKKRYLRYIPPVPASQAWFDH